MSKLPYEEGWNAKEWESENHYWHWPSTLDEHLVKNYKCYKCGKIETGKNLDRLYYYDRYESWYLEFWDDDSGQRFVYQRDFHLSELEIDWKTLCAECGKIRSREVELLNLEIRKVKATENIGIAISQIGTAVERMKYELQRFNDHDGYRG